MHVRIVEEDADKMQMKTHLMLAELIFKGKLTMMTVIPRSRRTINTTNLESAPTNLEMAPTNLGSAPKINRVYDKTPSEL